MRPRPTVRLLRDELKAWQQVQREAATDPHYSTRYRAEGATIALSMLIERLEGQA